MAVEIHSHICDQRMYCDQVLGADYSRSGTDDDEGDNWCSDVKDFGNIELRGDDEFKTGVIVDDFSIDERNEVQDICVLGLILYVI